MRHELVVCGWDEVFVLATDTRQDGPPEKVWSWRAAGRPELPDGVKGAFSRTDECKPLEGGSRILITSSTGGVALVERETGAALFHTTVPNAHSAEMLPAQRIAVAGSGAEDGNRLLVFDIGRPDEPFYADELSWAHGVVWDEARRLLWALGADELRAYELCRWGSAAPSLSPVASFKLPDRAGHDLGPVPHTALLVVTTGEHVYHFDRDRRTFAPHPALGGVPGVKGVSVNRVTGRTAYVQAEGGHWWAERIRFLDPDGVYHVPGEHFYKVRWNQPGQ